MAWSTPAGIARLIDANGNRAREAARTLEDLSRFVLRDGALAGRLKRLRHGVPRTDPAGQHARDTPGDPGTAVTVASEASRCDTRDVAVAAGRRLTEALRVLEEAAKLRGDPAGASEVERLRYAAYELERLVVARCPPRRRTQFRLCVLLTQRWCRLPWDQVLEGALRGGADCIQVREKQMPAGLLLDRVRRVLDASHRHASQQGSRAAVIVNDRPDVAAAAEADGVHVGQADLPARLARSVVGDDRLVGVSTGGLTEARAAKEAGADYCGVGPMFETSTKTKPTIAGPAYLAAYLAEADALPHLAIGGISAPQLPELRSVGVRGIAVTAAVCGADEPERATAELLAGLPEPSAPRPDQDQVQDRSSNIRP